MTGVVLPGRKQRETADGHWLCRDAFLGLMYRSPHGRQVGPRGCRRKNICIGSAQPDGILSPNGTTLCQPRPTAWGQPIRLDIQAQRAGPKLVAVNRSNDPFEPELVPPRWGFVWRGVTVTQADGLGWHRAATLWRKKSKTRNESHTVTKKTSLKIRVAGENRDGKAIGASALIGTLRKTLAADHRNQRAMMHKVCLPLFA